MNRLFWALATVLLLGSAMAETLLPAFAPEAIPATRLEAFRGEIDGRLERFAQLLDMAQVRVERTLPVGTLQRERALARLEVARTVPGYIRRNLSAADADGVRYAYLAADDMREFLRYFDEELRLWESFPRERTAQDAGNSPKVFNLVRDFGARGDGTTDTSLAWEKAMAAIAARQGVPTILEIPEGRFVFLDSEGRKPMCNMPVVAISNLLVRGVSPERTWLVAGVYGKASLIVSKCVNVAVRDLSVSTVEPTYCEGKVLAVDVAKAQITIQHNPTTLRPDEKKLNAKEWSWQCCTAYDDAGRILRTQNLSWTYDPSVDLGDGTWLLQMNPKSPVRYVKPGMNLVLPNRCYPAGAASLADYSAFCSMERVHVRRSYAAAFGGAGRYSSFRGCKVLPMDGYRYATNADAFMACGGLYLADFEVCAPGDDCINDYVPSYKVGKVDGRMANPGRMHGVATDGRLRTFYSPSSGQYLSVNRVATNSYAWASAFEDAFPPDVVPQKTITCDVKAFGVGTVIRNCRFRNTRSGCHLQMPHVIMEDCSFENSVHGCGVRVGCHVLEGNPPYNVSIRRVRVKNAWTGFRTERIGASKDACATPIHGVTIEDCDVEDVVNCHWFQHVSDLTLRDVRFRGQTVEKNAFGERTNNFLSDHCGDIRRENVTLNGEPVEMKGDTPRQVPEK